MTITLLLTLLDDIYYLPEWATCAHRIAPDEILVVDGGSTDGGPEFLERQGLPNFRLIRRPMDEIDWHYSEQLNFAARQARHEWILLLDADEILWPPGRRVIEQAIRWAEPQVVSLWLARFHLWPDEQTRLDWGSDLDRQPRLWKADAGIRWVRKVHSLQLLNGQLVFSDNDQAELIPRPVILHRKLTAPHAIRLARHRRWRDHWAEASAQAGMVVPEELPDDYGPTLPLPPRVATWRTELMGLCASLTQRGQA